MSVGEPGEWIVTGHSWSGGFDLHLTCFIFLHVLPVSVMEITTRHNMVK